MRIAYVCADPGVPVFGAQGSSVHVQEVVRAFARRGADVTLLAARLGGDRPSELGGVHVHHVPPAIVADAAAWGRASLAANAAVHAALESDGPFDLVYERCSLWSYAGMEYARAAGIPGVLEVNAPLIDEESERRVVLDRALAVRAAERATGAARLVVAVSDELAAYLAQFAAARCRVTVIPGAADPERFRGPLVPELPAGRGVFTVGFVGSLAPWQGLSVLVEAFAALHERGGSARLLIVGGGPLRAELERDLERRRLDDLAILTGAVPPGSVPGMLASMDVAVAPYGPRRTYSSPLKLFEYMAAGLPVVTSRVGQMSRLVRDDVTGVLCPPDDPRPLAASLARLRADPALRARLGAAARAWVAAEHTWDGVVRRVLALAGLDPASADPPREP